MKFTLGTYLRGVLRDPACIYRHFRYGDVSSISLDEIAKYITSEAPVIVEAGVFNGEDTIRFVAKWPNATIFGFEPHPTLYKLASSKLSGYPRVTLFEMALVKDATISDVTLYSGSEANGDPHASSSLLEPSSHLKLFPDVAFGELFAVSATNLDTWGRSRNIGAVDLLWLDLQGLELQALEGSVCLLEKVSFVYLEVCRTPLYEGACTLSELVEFMNAMGFELVKLRAPFVVGNALFSRVGSTA